MTKEQRIKRAIKLLENVTGKKVVLGEIHKPIDTSRDFTWKAGKGPYPGEDMDLEDGSPEAELCKTFKSPFTATYYYEPEDKGDYWTPGVPEECQVYKIVDHNGVDCTEHFTEKQIDKVADLIINEIKTRYEDNF